MCLWFSSGTLSPSKQLACWDKGATRSGKRERKVERHELSVNMSIIISDGKGPNFVDFGLSMVECCCMEECCVKCCFSLDTITKLSLKGFFFWLCEIKVWLAGRKGCLCQVYTICFDKHAVWIPVWQGRYHNHDFQEIIVRKWLIMWKKIL